MHYNKSISSAIEAFNFKLVWINHKALTLLLHTILLSNCIGKVDCVRKQRAIMLTAPSDRYQHSLTFCVPPTIWICFPNGLSPIRRNTNQTRRMAKPIWNKRGSPYMSSVAQNFIQISGLACRILLSIVHIFRRLYTSDEKRPAIPVTNSIPAYNISIHAFHSAEVHNATAVLLA